MGLGGLRFVLALLVVVDHLTGVAATDHLGRCAVFGFYVLSGFLITRVLHVGYAFDGGRFWANRFLRLFPVYYAVAGLTLLVVLLFPETAARYHGAFVPIGGVMDYANNVLLLPLAFTHGPFRLVPPTWSVAVEIINYGLLWLFMARSALFASIALSLGVAYHIAAFALGLDYYTPFYAAVLPFACGAMLYFVRPLSPKYGGPAFLLLLAYLLVAQHLIGDTRVIVYGSTILVVIVVASMACASSTRIDQTLGDMAYPIFLTHWLAGLLVVLVVPSLERGWLLLGLSIVPAALLSWLLTEAARSLIEPLRTQIKQHHHTQLSLG